MDLEFVLKWVKSVIGWALFIFHLFDVHMVSLGTTSIAYQCPYLKAHSHDLHLMHAAALDSCIDTLMQIF